ncbi:acyl-CoA dehydrogenase [Exophiala viscosa]|uniref:Acyl-CoA dehydrogenase n=1 Tax=Exophiala viscosa TaxID=2486360 RepID=A0AAN6IA45_9EURO|nr:acyl-CoA dehydrogenase [Exophiala viscosa]
MSNTTADISSIPFAEPSYLRGLPSPYFRPTHLNFQKRCRLFLSEHFLPYALDWETEGDVPAHVWEIFNKHHMLVPNLSSPLPVDWLKRLKIHDILGVPVEEWDYLHSAIFVDERARIGITGPNSSLYPGFAYGIPPILRFGSPALQEKFLPQLLTGKARTCIAITEPQAGSDVANIETIATKSSDGSHYILNGAKKWITNGIWADYASTAVRTGRSGAGGISIIVVPLKDYPGVTMRRMKIMGQHSAGTTYIKFDDVKVPVENLLGKEGEGMKYIMTNFNHERMMIAVGVCRQARVALSSAVEYAMKREAFGKTLIEQPVVRHRIATAAADLETLQSLVFEFAYQLTHLSKTEADGKLGGATALLKAKAGMVLNDCAQTAVLIFGGNGITRTGQGELVEKIFRDVMGARIPGGSEDVMLDLAVRQLVKDYRKESSRIGGKL